MLDSKSLAPKTNSYNRISCVKYIYLNICFRVGFFFSRTLSISSKKQNFSFSILFEFCSSSTFKPVSISEKFALGESCLLFFDALSLRTVESRNALTNLKSDTYKREG